MDILRWRHPEFRDRATMLVDARHQQRHPQVERASCILRITFSTFVNTTTTR